MLIQLKKHIYTAQKSYLLHMTQAIKIAIMMKSKDSNENDWHTNKSLQKKRHNMLQLCGVRPGQRESERLQTLKGTVRKEK